MRWGDGCFGVYARCVVENPATWVANEVVFVNMWETHYTTAVEADTAGGGGISGASSFRFLPFGAGSSGVLL